MPVWLIAAIVLALALHFGSARHEAGSDSWWSQTLVICLVLVFLAAAGLFFPHPGFNHFVMQRITVHT